MPLLPPQPTKFNSRLSAHTLPHTQIDLVHNLQREEKLSRLPVYKALLEHLTRQEIIPWPLPEDAELSLHPVLVASAAMSVDGGGSAKDDDSPRTDWKKVLHDCVVEHNVRIVAGYYTRIRTSRLAEFLQLSEDEAEAYVSKMVTSATMPLFARIDRPAGIVSFQRKKDANDILSEWASNIGELLGLVEKTCHLIHKERMVHEAARLRAENSAADGGGGSAAQ